MAAYAILKILKDNFDYDVKEVNSDKIKIIYVCPHKKLIKGICNKLSSGLKGHDIKILPMSEDFVISTNEIIHSNIIVTTPIKLDLFTQYSSEFWNSVDLLIIEDI